MNSSVCLELLIYRGKYFHVYESEENDFDFKMGCELDESDLYASIKNVVSCNESTNYISSHELISNIISSVKLLDSNTLNIILDILKTVKLFDISSDTAKDIIMHFIKQTNTFYKLKVYNSGNSTLELAYDVPEKVTRELTRYIFTNLLGRSDFELDL